jgi:hypothetical protein
MPWDGSAHDLDQRHSGIFGVYQDNDPSRDMSNADVVRAIRNLEEAARQGGPSIPAEFHTPMIGDIDGQRTKCASKARGMAPGLVTTHAAS